MNRSIPAENGVKDNPSKRNSKYKRQNVFGESFHLQLWGDLHRGKEVWAPSLTAPCDTGCVWTGVV